jgi:putative transposase
MKGLSRCSPDKAAAEGFFGRLKQEFFHKRSFAGVASRIPFGPTGKHCSLFNDRKFFEFHWLSLALSMSQTRFVRSVLLGFTVVFLAIFPLPHRAASCRAARRFSPLV